MPENEASQPNNSPDPVNINEFILNSPFYGDPTISHTDPTIRERLPGDSPLVFNH